MAASSIMRGDPQSDIAAYSGTNNGRIAQISDWWNNPTDGIDRLETVRSEAWEETGGLTHGSCRVAGSIATRWPLLTRVNTLTWDHHRAVAKLQDEQAIPLLETAVNQNLSARELRALAKADRRSAREVELADKIDAASGVIGQQLYGVIYMDPPWRFEPKGGKHGYLRLLSGTVG